MARRPISRRAFAAFSTGACAALPTLPAQTAGRSERLKITKIELFKVVVLMQDDINSSPEMSGDDLSEFPKTPKFIMKVHTDSGIIGIGETARGVREQDLRKNVDYLVGKDIFDLNLTNLNLPYRREYAGFEIALYDAVGKAVRWPVYRLLGGWRSEGLR